MMPPLYVTQLPKNIPSQLNKEKKNLTYQDKLKTELLPDSLKSLKVSKKEENQMLISSHTPMLTLDLLKLIDR